MHHYSTLHEVCKETLYKREPSSFEVQRRMQLGINLWLVSLPVIMINLVEQSRSKWARRCTMSDTMWMIALYMACEANWG